MYPVLQVGPLAIQTYPLALLVAGWTALAVGAWAASRRGLDGDHVYNAGFSGLAAGAVAGRLAHVVAFWPAYRSDPAAIIGFNTRAFLLWPALLAGLAVAGWYVYRLRLPLRTLLDAAAPGALAGFAFADLGAFLAGTDLGAPASLPWAVTVWGVERHPVQIYDMLAMELALIAVLVVCERSAQPGRAAWTALLGFGFSRWLLEPFRGESATVLNGLRSGQVLGLAFVLIALWALRPAGQPRAQAAPESSRQPSA